MGRADSVAESLLKKLLATAVTPALKEAGFRKKDGTYHRRRAEAVQVIQIQSSAGSTQDAKRFYVNVGIAFDPICTLAGLPILERPKEYECDDRGTRDRLESLLRQMPAHWDLHSGTSVEATASVLGDGIQQLRNELDRIDGLAAYREHPWFERFRPAKTNAQVFYLLGELDAAWQEVQTLAQFFFADRKNADSAEWWIEKLGLSKLGDRTS